MKNSRTFFEHIDDFSELLRSLQNIQTLSLYNNGLDMENIKALADALKQNTSITRFHLCENMIGIQGAQFFAETLANNTTFQIFSLYVNQIGDQGAEILAKSFAMAVNHHVTELSLCKNEILNLKVFSRLLCTNTTLTRLSLLRNQFGDQGALFLAHGLKNNATLKILNIDHNEIGDQGAEALGQSLQKNTKLKKLSFSFNRIGDRGLHAFRKVKNLDTLNLMSNQIQNFNAWNIPFQYLLLDKNPIAWQVSKMSRMLCNNFVLETLPWQEFPKSDERANIIFYCDRNRKGNIRKIKFYIFFSKKKKN